MPCRCRGYRSTPSAAGTAGSRCCPAIGPTPCTELDVQALCGHLIGTARRAEGLAARADRRAFEIEREREILRLQVQLAAKASEARRIGEDTIPQAERAVVLVRECRSEPRI